MIIKEIVVIPAQMAVQDGVARIFEIPHSGRVINPNNINITDKPNNTGIRYCIRSFFCSFIRMVVTSKPLSILA
jgi:hypothetical protein